MEILNVQQEDSMVARPGLQKAAAGRNAGMQAGIRKPGVKPRRALGDITNGGARGKGLGNDGPQKGGLSRRPSLKEANPKAKVEVQAAAKAVPVFSEPDDIEYSHPVSESEGVDFLKDIGFDIDSAMQTDTMEQLVRGNQAKLKPFTYEPEIIEPPEFLDGVPVDNDGWQIMGEEEDSLLDDIDTDGITFD